MDASAFVNKHCNFAEASMMASELGQSSSHVVAPVVGNTSSASAAQQSQQQN